MTVETQQTDRQTDRQCKKFFICGTPNNQQGRISGKWASFIERSKSKHASIQ